MAVLPGVRGAVFWSGAYKAPVMGDERPVEIDSPRQPANRVSSRTKVTVKKLEVSGGGDMAWEYSDGQLSYELKDGTNGTFRNATLRVWRKVDGAWRVVAHFSQRNAESTDFDAGSFDAWSVMPTISSRAIARS